MYWMRTEPDSMDSLGNWAQSDRRDGWSRRRAGFLPV